MLKFSVGHQIINVLSSISFVLWTFLVVSGTSTVFAASCRYEEKFYSTYTCNLTSNPPATTPPPTPATNTADHDPRPRS